MPANGCPPNVEAEHYARVQAKLHPSLRDSMAVPSDLRVPMTREQLDYLFGGDRRALAEIARLAMPEHASEPITEVEVLAHAGSNGAQPGA